MLSTDRTRRRVDDDGGDRGGRSGEKVIRTRTKKYPVTLFMIITLDSSDCLADSKFSNVKNLQNLGQLMTYAHYLNDVVLLYFVRNN